MENAVSVIIPVYNGEKTIDKCLKSVFMHSKYIKEVIVVDDHSQDRTLEIVQKYSCRIVKLNQHKGPAVARNTGVACAESEILFFTDADVEILPDTIIRGIRRLRNYPEYAAVIGAYSDDTPVENFVSKYKNYLHHYTHCISDGEIFSFFTACGFIWKKTFEQVEGFDGSITTTALEDVDLGIRLAKSGYKILLDKSVQVVHLKRYTFFSLVKSDVFNRAVPYTVLFIQHKIFNSELSTGSNNIMSVLLLYISILMEIMLRLLKIHNFKIYRIITPCLLFLLNAKFYICMKRKYTLSFMIKGITMHWLGYFYSGLGVAFGMCSYLYKYFGSKNRGELQNEKNEK